MRGIGGNTTATIQVSTATRNDIGETVRSWADIQTVKGWLDLQGGDARYSTYHAKIQESTHIFFADFVPLNEKIKAENARMIIGGNRYDVLLIDNPMGLGGGSQLEFYLKFTGGQ